ncbi:hypothetical protein BB558_000490 [Smittium angustum]|uniref:Large ribosomal subunit protein eL39 n=1 Tax=Smittium angustum TaxID=133377 RepID=A0A2U1JE19_SMIAN|nr:hypothetical protein BB558_004277 [Smittium angustum]PWA02297.1 hypothetical protein BB558_001574 [Smittium angustum]PWA03342.1 hypothetical protein BB558_000490 [Smittium angustum]
MIASTESFSGIANNAKNQTATYRFLLYTRPSQKTFRTKRILGKKQKQNRPIPNWFRMKSDTKIRYNAKRRNWRRTKLGI